MAPELVFCYALSVIFGVFLGACAAAIARDSSSHCGLAGMENALILTGLGIGIFCLAVEVLCFRSFYPGTVGALFFLFVYVVGTWGSPKRTGVEVALKMKVSEKLIANEGAILSLLDYDQDGVVSSEDVVRSTPRVVGSALTTEEIECLRANINEFGHCIDKNRSFYVLSRSDLGNLAGRMRELYKAWLSP